MDGIDTADDGFIQTKEKSEAENGAFIALDSESNQEKIEKMFRAEKYLESKGFEFYWEKWKIAKIII